MYEDIRKNKIKTGAIVSLFIIMITLIVYYICTAFDLGPASITIALTISIISTLASYYNCDKIVLASCKARPATKEENQKLVNILDALVVSSGLSHTPRLFVVEDRQANAFATGRNPQNSIICVTTGLLEKLDYYELEGVIAHELAHIRNYDILLSAIISVMVGLIVMLSDMYTRTFLWRRNRDNNDRNSSNGLIIIIGLLCLVLSPIFSKLIQLAVSRRREYLADATAIQFTRNPNGLISALKKISGDPNELETANNATAHMFISEPFRNNAYGKQKQNSLFSTHPSIDDRIEAIKNLK